MGVVALALCFHARKYQAAHFPIIFPKQMSEVVSPMCLLSVPVLPHTRPKVLPLTGPTLKGAAHQYFISANDTKQNPLAECKYAVKFSLKNGCRKSITKSEMDAAVIFN